MDRCTTCQYYDRQNKGSGIGQCRREAPALSPVNVKPYMIEGVWPTVRDDDWCGEWKASQRRLEARPSMDLLAGALPPPATQVRPVAMGAAALSVPLPMAIGAGTRGND